MKRIQKIFYLSLFLGVFISCQNEITEIVQPPEGETLQANANVTTLVSKTVTKDGSIDNIIDNANCVTIQLPVTVVVNGLEIIIDSEADFQVIEDIFDEFGDDEDELQIIFPIVIILSDFSEITITNFSELEAFTNQCSGENEIDDDIECIDFVYPITISVYDSANQLVETITIENDQQFYHLIDAIEDFHIVQINFPITVVLFDGTEMVINSLNALENAIESADDMCDEDDDNDFNDDDCFNCTEAQITELLLTCAWTVDKLEINNVDHAEQYTSYLFTFFEDGTVEANDNGAIVMGTWSANGSGNNIIVTINFNDLSDFSFQWILHEIEEENGEIKVDLRIGENRLRFEKTCINNNASSELVNTLKEGTWAVTNFNNEGVNETNNYTDFVFDFKEDFTVTATKNGDVVGGTWTVILDSGELKLDLNFGETNPFDELNEDWLVITIATTKVELKDVDETTGVVSNLVFERL